MIKSNKNILDNNIVGTIKMFAGNNIPSNYLICDGSLLNRTVYSTLFNAIGTIYGIGDGNTTFQLPDFGGTSPEGSSTSTKLKDNDQHNTFLTAVLGTYRNGFVQNWQLGVSADSSGVKNYWAEAVNRDFSINGTSTAGYVLPQLNTAFQGGGNMLKAMNDGTHGTPSTDHYTKGPTLAVNFIIKYI